MHTILIVTGDRARLGALADAVKAEPTVELRWAANGAEAMAAARNHPPLAAVIDEALADMGGLDLVRRLLPINALINTAVLSDQDPDSFHETSEGLGILAQLPSTPTPENAADLFDRLRRIKAL